MTILQFGSFELDTGAEQLRREGRTIRLQPQPFKLLRLLVEAGGHVVSREEIRSALWPDDTFVDYDQGVNFAIRQVREALGDDAERPLYVQTVPRRGYRFVAPILTPPADGQAAGSAADADLNLHKALWANIAELRLAEHARHRRRKVVVAAAGTALLLAAVLLLIWFRF
jgi:DNA-binding winged helix-turn-helix (wHTH) protein